MLNAVGFTFVAVYYETRYVTRVLSAGGSGWLFGGYHWLGVLGLPVPGRIVFLILYLYRRRVLLGRVADDVDSLDRLPTAGDSGPGAGRDTEGELPEEQTDKTGQTDGSHVQERR